MLIFVYLVKTSTVWSRIVILKHHALVFWQVKEGQNDRLQSLTPLPLNLLSSLPALTAEHGRWRDIITITLLSTLSIVPLIQRSM